MKWSLTILLLVSSFQAFGAPCNGAPGIYSRNPDGSNGGFIARGAVVSNTAFIDADSEICGKVKISGNAKILGGSVIEENVTIEGSPRIVSSTIFGFAKISGGAVIQNSTICQTSIIEGFKVINSSYYCQTEDPAPKDPGEAGKKTLLGVDSDGDGVRDDIEVLINNMLSNTPNKDNSQERIAAKIFAKILQKEILLKQSPEAVKTLLQEKIDLSNCFNLSIADDVLLNMYDTKERLFALFKTAGYVHGERVRLPSKGCKTLPMFDFRVRRILGEN